VINTQLSALLALQGYSVRRRKLGPRVLFKPVLELHLDAQPATDGLTGERFLFWSDDTCTWVRSRAMHADALYQKEECPCEVLIERGCSMPEDFKLRWLHSGW